MTDHKRRTVEEFTKQAPGFSTAPQIKDEEALVRIIEFAGARSEDTVLDVACGPGIVTCAFAEVVGQATGIDLTPAMIERARALQQDRAISNVAWSIGDVSSLPFTDQSFSLVISRYAFHHLTDPVQVFREMKRVCRPRGKVVLVDVTASSDPARAAAFNHMERLRDPSHVRALALDDMHKLFESAGMAPPRVTHYRLEFNLEPVLEGSFPVKGGKEEIRRLFRESVESDAMGLQPRRRVDDDDDIVYSYPISVLVSERPAVV